MIEPDIDFSARGNAIPEHFVGLSYETEQVLPRPDRGHYFSPRNASLIALFKTLGIRSLRIGGNSVDRPVTAIPDTGDIDELFNFARAAGAKVIYTVRLQEGDPQSAANVARHIAAHHADQLDCFAIGNEPAYYKPYENYREKWRPIMRAIRDAVPDAQFCGPDTNPEPAWCRAMVEEFGAPRGSLAMLTVHSYPGDCSYANPGAKTVEELVPKDATLARRQMLSGAWESTYAKVHRGMADAVAGTSLPFRLAETNNFWYGGLEGASNTFAAALWSVEYLYWWLAHGAAGLNFHTGDRVGGGSTSLTSRYTAFVTSGDGYDIRPLGYGIKLFTLGAVGELVPVSLNGANDSVRAFATRSSRGGGGCEIHLTLINKSDAPVAVRTASPIHRTISLTAPALAATTGLQLGGSAIDSNGNWTGEWTPHDGNAPFVLPAGSASVLEMAG